MTEPVKIAIVIEGGCLSAVLSAGVAVDFVLIDYDVEGDTDALASIPQGNGSSSLAALSEPDRAGIDGPFVMQAHVDGFPRVRALDEESVR